MDYEQFKAEYSRVFEAVDAGESAAALAPEIARLKELADTIEDPAQRRSAGNRIADIEDILKYDDEPPPSPAMEAAIRAHAAANADGGTPAERIARAEAGMAEISRIAEAADRSEQAAILDMNESLYMLILALEPDTR